MSRRGFEVTQAPSLTVVCGLPGVGKTMVARTAAGVVDGEVLRTDVLRKTHFPEPAYTDPEERSVYVTLFDQAAKHLSSGTPAVLDGTFHDRRYRDRAEDVADDVGVPCRFVHVVCDTSVVRDRIAAREDDESDATFEIYKRFQAEFDSVEREHAVVDNSGPKDRTQAQVRGILTVDAEVE